MLTENECKKILNEHENLYTDAEIKLIKEWLYQVAEITINALEQKNKKNKIQ